MEGVNDKLTAYVCIERSGNNAGRAVRKSSHSVEEVGNVTHT